MVYPDLRTEYISSIHFEDQGGGGVAQRIDINIDGLNEGGLVSADDTRKLIMSINDQLGDGVNLNVDPDGSGTGS